MHKKEVPMSEHRFHLEKYYLGGKIACPACKRTKCFVRYIDERDIIKFPSDVGRCDHENSCGYHYTPKDFFHDNPDMKPKDWDENYTPAYQPKSIVGKEVTKPTAPSFIPSELVCKSLKSYTINPLYKYLCGVIGKEETTRVFQLYRVGTGKKWGGCAVFWQTDINGNVRAGKLMGYDNSGHRIKEPLNYVTWAHSELSLPNFHLVQCLFGEHLLRNSPTATVAMVESEKTAVFMSHFMPDLLWLATGGKDGCFNPDAVRVLQGRKVILFPDLNAERKWQMKSEMLKPICSQVIISDVIERIATTEQREKSLDIADFYLMQPTKRQILDDMIRRNPAVKLLIEKLNLELCDDNE